MAPATPPNQTASHLIVCALPAVRCPRCCTCCDPKSPIPTHTTDWTGPTPNSPPSPLEERACADLLPIPSVSRLALESCLSTFSSAHLNSHDEPGAHQRTVQHTPTHATTALITPSPSVRNTCSGAAVSLHILAPPSASRTSYLQPQPTGSTRRSRPPLPRCIALN